jgi:hypothetical protein
MTAAANIKSTQHVQRVLGELFGLPPYRARTEVAEAIDAGRCASEPPPPIGARSRKLYPDTLYAWTEDLRRCYALVPDKRHGNLDMLKIVNVW